MDDQDDYRYLEDTLRQLVQVLQHIQKGSREWRKAMNQLLGWIPTLPKLARCTHPSYPDVLNETLELIFEKIQEFRPRLASVTHSFVAWINYKLRHKYRVLELCREQPALSLDTEIFEGESKTTFVELLADPHPSTIWELEEKIACWQQQENSKRIGKQLWNYIQRDPDGRLRNCVSRGHPHCSCQEIAIRLYLGTPPQKLPKIAEELNIPYQTLIYQWKNKFHPLLQTIAREFGYSPNQDL
jgi:hypothetical protein